MNLVEFCEGIHLNSSVQHILYNSHMDEKLYESYKQQLYNDKHSFYDKVKQEKEYRKLFLYLYVRFAVDAHEEYQAKGINDDIYFDTFSDIQIWCSNCFRDFGEYGIQNYNWFQELVRLKIFKLGRLEFQPYAFNYDLVLRDKRIFKSEIVLNIHIPQGEPLDNQKVEESFEHARSFFRGIPPIFVCNSWLLYPGLIKVLKPGSNILQFQKHFFVYKIDDTSRQAEERIFNKISDDFSTYEENTNLQRSAKIYLVAGNKLGVGYGIM